MSRATSRWHVCETNAHRFALIPHVHGTKPIDNLLHQTSIMHRYAGGVHPIHALGGCLHTRTAALKEEVDDPSSTPLAVQVPQPYGHTGHQRLLQPYRATRHDGLVAHIAIRPLAGRAEGGGVWCALGLVMLGTLACLFHPYEGLLTLLQAFPMPWGRGLGHRDLWHLARFTRRVNPRWRGLQRRVEWRALALRMAVGTDDLCAAIVARECPMVDQALATVFLPLGSRSGHPWPRRRRQGLLDLRGAPGPQRLACGGFDDHTGP
jgi:hypothetical protein